jgi:hypothetical protein
VDLDVLEDRGIADLSSEVDESLHGLVVGEEVCTDDLV